MVLVALTFWSLLAAVAWRTPEALRDKPVGDWIVDLGNLIVQGVAVPVLQITLVAGGLTAIAPGARASIDLPAPAAFALAFVGVDYLYYWNHRLLHGEALWWVHRVHHTVTRMDVLATSRNTLWTSLLVLYVWAGGALLYLLAHPAAYAAGAALTSALDLWRHSELHPPAAVARWLRPWLILPEDHARHHGASAPRGNFGANLKLWDRLHGTALPSGPPEEPLGVPPLGSIPRTLLWPAP
ncbi:MAG TPA: sterol desaturase family protein [Myxococcota bacterium]|nr:sterol desaturase family protein [Myxococcota bacterium]